MYSSLKAAVLTLFYKTSKCDRYSKKHFNSCSYHLSFYKIHTSGHDSKWKRKLPKPWVNKSNLKGYVKKVSFLRRASIFCFFVCAGTRKWNQCKCTTIGVRYYSWVNTSNT